MERIWELCVRRRELHSTCGALWQKKWSCDCIEMESIVSAFKKLLCRKKRGESGATRQRDICMAFIMIIKSRGTEK